MRPNTIIEGAYGFTKYEGGPTDHRPDLTDAERDAARRADRLTLKDLQKASGLTIDEINHAITAWGFPKPTTKDVGGPGRPQYVRSYSKSSIREWRARFAPLAEKFIDLEF